MVWVDVLVPCSPLMVMYDDADMGLIVVIVDYRRKENLIPEELNSVG